MRLANGDLEWVVEPAMPSLRLDHWLKLKLTRYSRTELQTFVDAGAISRLLHSGQLLVLKPASRVRGGDIIRLRRPTPPKPQESLPQGELVVLYEDDQVMVVDKPAGMLVHPAGVRLDGTVIGILREKYAGFALDLAHRLDRETSGLLLLTKGLAACRTLKDAFRDRKVEKRYQAIVRGIPTWEELRVDQPMGDSQGEIRVRQAIRADGAPAVTVFRCLKGLGAGHALVEALPQTGRLHQIRVHLEAVGHPLVGDKIYGHDGQAFLAFTEAGMTDAIRAELGHWRHALHASHLGFLHPATGNWMEFHTPLPADLIELSAQLE